LGVFEDERLPDAECLSVDFEGALAPVVLDPEVISNRNQLLPHLVLDRVSSPSKSLAILSTLLASLLPAVAQGHGAS
jgi:hypothetical protein